MRTRRDDVRCRPGKETGIDGIARGRTLLGVGWFRYGFVGAVAVLTLGAVEIAQAPPAHAAALPQSLIGDFDGDGDPNNFYYRPGPTVDGWFTSNGDFVEVAVNGTYTPLVGDFSADGADDIIWYAPGTTADWLWDFNPGGAFTSSRLTVNGTYRPVVSDFSGDGADDVIWYAPGTVADWLWDFNPGGAFTSSRLTVNGTYRPVAGRFTADATPDIFWYAPGSARDYLWRFTGTSFAFTSSSAGLQVVGTYLTAVLDAFGDGQDDILFANSGPGPEYLWDFQGNKLRDVTLDPGLGDTTFTQIETQDGTSFARFFDGNASPPYGNLSSGSSFWSENDAWGWHTFAGGDYLTSGSGSFTWRTFL
jgi:hypothetical protein